MQISCTHMLYSTDNIIFAAVTYLNGTVVAVRHPNRHKLVIFVST